MGGKAAKPAKARPVVESFGQAHVREVVPGREQKGAEQRQRWPARLSFGRDTCEQAVQLRPVYQGRNIVQRPAPARLRATDRQLFLPDLTTRHRGLQHPQEGMESHGAQPNQPPAHRSHDPSF